MWQWLSDILTSLGFCHFLKLNNKDLNVHSQYLDWRCCKDHSKSKNFPVSRFVLFFFSQICWNRLVNIEKEKYFSGLSGFFIFYLFEDWMNKINFSSKMWKRLYLLPDCLLFDPDVAVYICEVLKIESNRQFGIFYGIVFVTKSKIFPFVIFLEENCWNFFIIDLKIHCLLKSLTTWKTFVLKWLPLSLDKNSQFFYLKQVAKRVKLFIIKINLFKCTFLKRFKIFQSIKPSLTKT